jgi:hypothetical protein
MEPAASCLFQWQALWTISPRLFFSRWMVCGSKTESWREAPETWRVCALSKGTPPISTLRCSRAVQAARFRPPRWTYRQVIPGHVSNGYGAAELSRHRQPAQARAAVPPHPRRRRCRPAFIFQKRVLSYRVMRDEVVPPLLKTNACARLPDPSRVQVVDRHAR